MRSCDTSKQLKFQDQEVRIQAKPTALRTNYSDGRNGCTRKNGTHLAVKIASCDSANVKMPTSKLSL